MSNDPPVIVPLPSPEMTPPTLNAPFREFLALKKRTNCPLKRLFGGGALITVMFCCWSLLVGSAVEVAVMVTVLPEGGALGAVYVVGAPLAVCAGENVPQAPGLPQETVQSTPALEKSLLTVATRDAVRFAPGGHQCARPLQDAGHGALCHRI